MPKQLLLYRFFGWQPPRFAHLPLLRNRDRSKISKRKNPAARLLWFAEEGFLPPALLNFLALQGWSMPDGREKFTFDDVVANFDVERFSPVGPIFDVEKLDWMNGKYIEELGDDELLERIRPFLPGPGEEEGLRILAPELKTRLKRLKDACEQAEFLFLSEVDVEPQLLIAQGAKSGSPTAVEALMTAESVLRNVEPYDAAHIKAALEAEPGRHGWKPGPFFMPIRVAISGRTRTPPVVEMLAALGKERALFRLRDAIDRVAPGVA
jgi:glutamyl-tRNA synthetase